MRQLFVFLATAMLFVACGKDDAEEFAAANEPVAVVADGSGGGSVMDAADAETIEPVFANGTLPGYFTVGSRKVRFAQGNLQYCAATNQWRFARHQYDVVGGVRCPGNVACDSVAANNDSASAAYGGWIDLFGFGTSGYNGMAPYMRSADPDAYLPGITSIAGSNYDWGVYNAIEGATPTGDSNWRTLTFYEWNYLIGRNTNLFGLAYVGDVFGLVLLPDGWSAPSDVPTFKPYSLGIATSYTVQQWQSMEQAGAVFLPAAGYRGEKGTKLTKGYGYYWTTDFFSASGYYSGSPNHAHIVQFNDYEFCCVMPVYRHYGLSVRLVR